MFATSPYAPATFHCPGKVDTALEKLRKQGNLTFYKNFQNASGVNADYSLGSGTGTFTRTASNTTYVDSNGVLQLVSAANTPRYSFGYYGGTFTAVSQGLMIEAATTNYLKTTYGNADANADGVADNWAVANSTANAPTKSLVANTSFINIADSKAQRIVYVDGADTNKAITLSQDTAAASFAEADPVTASCYVKGSSTGVTTIKLYAYTYSDVPAAVDTASSDAITLSTSWQRVSVSIASAGALTNFVRYVVRVDSIDQGDTVDLYVTGMQVEKTKYATSYVPTTTAAATRNSDRLIYDISGNRTSPNESIFIKFTPANSGTGFHSTITTKTKNRWCGYATKPFLYPNNTDDIVVLANNGTNTAINVSAVDAYICNHDASPYAEIYKNGSSIATYTVGTYTEPVWSGDTFSIGSVNTVGTTFASWLNGTIQKVAIYSGVKGSTYVSTITNILNS